MRPPLLFANGISIELKEEGRAFLGIGEVCFKGLPLRSPQLPWNFYTETENADRGLRFEDFILEEVRQSGDRVDLFLRSPARPLPRLQEADAMGEARIKNRRLAQPEARFTWTFQALTEVIWGKEWQGLSMQIEYHCPGYPLHWMLEQATWEIGGEAQGAVLIQQDVSAMDLEKKVEKGDAFSTVEKFFTEGWGGSYPMDMLPRAAGASICDFQAKGETALCLFSEDPGLTRARLDKFADEEVIHYLDRPYFPLADRVSTPVRKLLVYGAGRELEKHEIRNLWLDCFSEVRARIFARYGFKLEIPEPCTGAHLWDDDLRKWKERWADPLERDLAEYGKLGYTQVFIHGVWDSITSDPSPPEAGNICCPYSFRFAEVFGGPERMKKLNDRAAENGMRLMQWFSFHLSKHAPVWKEHPDWVLQEANGDPWDGNYQSLWSGRMRSGYGRHFENEILEVMAETGIDGIFWDSYQNLGVTCLDWGAADKAPQAEEIFRMQAELQRKGFKQRVEVVTIFGVSQVALFGFRDDKFRRRLWDDFVRGDQAFALIDCSPAFFANGESMLGPDKLSPERYFWMAAHRSVPGISADPWELGGSKTRLPGGEKAEEYARVNHLYNRALARMSRLRLQKGGTHVLWLDTDGNPSVLWVFEEIDSLYGSDWLDLETGQPVSGKRLKAGSVYAHS